LHTAIVIPCLNEERDLERTCASLGFGVGRNQSIDETFLVLVDNGSEDATRLIMDRIRDESPPGAVSISVEPEQGYVPPRNRGVAIAKAVADAKAIPVESLLVLQADADTIYASDYVSAMKEYADRHEGNFLLEAVPQISLSFANENIGFMRTMRKADAEIESMFVEQTFDVIVADAVCGYTVRDFYNWGCHVREYLDCNLEMHAETSRLLIKARLLTGAEKQKVNQAIAFPSRRKVIKNPALHFATAGFPRESRWCEAWMKSYSGPTKLPEFDETGFEKQIEELIFLRQAHSIILFGVLPAYVASLTDRPDFSAQEKFGPLLRLLPPMSREEILSNTARLLGYALVLIDSRQNSIRKFLHDEVKH